MTKLFEGIPKDNTNADIGWMNNKAPFYNEGYKMAARELASDYAKKSTSQKDALVFPIIFLYRQYLELTLKDLIRELDRKLGYERECKILENHKLLPLWDAAIMQYETFIKQEIISLVFTSSPSKVRTIVNQFNQIDEDSFSFRYATNKKGQQTLNCVDHISVNNFKNQVEQVVSYLENMTETLAHTTI